MLRKFILTIAICLLPLSFALAATNPPPIIGGTLLPGVNAGISQQAGSNQGEKELNWLQNVFFKNTINKLIGWAAALSVVFLIIGGYQYLTAFGSDEQIKKAHKTITWSLVGVMLAMLAFAIVQIVVNLKLSGASTSTSTSSTATSTSASTYETDQAGYAAAQACMASSSNDTTQCKTCCATANTNATVVATCKDNCIPETAAASATTTKLDTSLGDGTTCGGGKGVCKSYGTGWSGCWANYSAYAAGAADCKSEKCCVPDATSTTSTTKTSASLLSAAVASSYNQEIQSIVPCFGGSCAVSEVAALPQGDFRDEFLPTIARFLIYAMGIVSFVVFFAAGAILVFSWGEEETTKKAKNAIVWGITGIAFAAASYLLVKGISSLDYMKTSTNSTVTSAAQSVIQNITTTASSTSSGVSTTSTTAITTPAEGGAACGGGKGICKNYGTGWSGCWANYSAYDAGAADCRSEKCCVPTTN